MNATQSIQKYSHTEAQKSLNFLSVAVNKLNEKRLELAHIEEKLDFDKKELERIAKQSFDLTSEYEGRTIALKDLEIRISAQERYYLHLIELSANKELEVQSSKGKHVVEKNRIEEAKRLRAEAVQKLEDLKEYGLEKTKAVEETIKKISILNADREHIQKEILAGQEVLKSHATMMLQERQQIEQERAGNREEKKRLSFIKRRLNEYAKELKISIEI